MRAFAEFGALLLVAGVAGLGNARLPEQTGGRDPRHGVVAVTAGDLVRGMRRTRPVDPLPPLVAVQTLGVLPIDRRPPLSREADDRVAIRCIRQMPGCRTVAGFAHLPLPFIAGILPEGPGVDGVTEVRILGWVAIGAGFFAHVGCRGVRVLFKRCGLRQGRRGRKQVRGQQHPAQRTQRRP